MEERDKATKVVEQFRRLGRWFGSWGNGPELKKSEWGALFAIFHSQRAGEEVRTSDVSRRMEVSPPALTPTLNQLEEKGLIQRLPSKTDRRTVYLRVTEQGEELCRRHWQRMREHFQSLTDYLGEEDSAELTRLLGRILEYYEQKDQ